MALTGDGGSIFLQNGLTGGLGAISITVSGSVSQQALLIDAFGGDQTIINGSKAVLLNLGNSESLIGGVDPNDTVSSFGNSVTISGGTTGYGNTIYAAGNSDSIATGTTAQDTVNATGNNDTIAANYADAITVSGNVVVVRDDERPAVSGSQQTLAASSRNPRRW